MSLRIAALALLLLASLARASAAETSLPDAIAAPGETVVVGLHAEGIDTEPMRYAPNGLRLKRRLSVVTGRAFQDGLVEIQDEGSQLVAALVDGGGFLDAAPPGSSRLPWPSP